ncbi:hypothetical protein AAFF_G00051820 [Aldrovandia affinis]|uniref:Uncharacterized protein n=1 Tax=Aldrovandia affinis TaxID=143900 RepID=A0AAD7WYW9_9TELE|nr:hypothetical protein AAFF_G00051820 [Aldrovandia affinis]
MLQDEYLGLSYPRSGNLAPSAQTVAQAPCILGAGMGLLESPLQPHGARYALARMVTSPFERVKQTPKRSILLAALKNAPVSITKARRRFRKRAGFVQDQGLPTLQAFHVGGPLGRPKSCAITRP